MEFKSLDENTKKGLGRDERIRGIFTSERGIRKPDHGKEEHMNVDYM
jgi:hypothetical protein